jgi:hypothetical protein
VRSPRIVEATGDRPTSAVRMRWRFEIEGSLADFSPTSLSQRGRHHLDNEKQQEEEKRAPTGARRDGSGSWFIHFLVPGWDANCSKLPRSLFDRPRALRTSVFC